MKIRQCLNRNCPANFADRLDRCTRIVAPQKSTDYDSVSHGWLKFQITTTFQFSNPKRERGKAVQNARHKVEA